MSYPEEHFKDWLKFVKKMGWKEDFIKHQVTSAMKSHVANLHLHSKVLLKMVRQPHNTTHINAFIFKD